MRKAYAVLVLAGFVATCAMAYPAIGGGRGLWRVQDALVEPEAGLTISIDAIGRNPVCSSSGECKALLADVVAPSLSYAPIATRFVGLELFGSWGGVFQDPEKVTMGSEEAKIGMGLHDLKAGGKLSIPIIPVLKLGFGGSYTFKSDRNDTSKHWWVDQKALPQAIDPKYTWTGMATLQFSELASALPNLMFNYGSVDDYTVYAAGIEFAARNFALFAEARSLQNTSDFGSFMDTEKGEIRITPGLAFGNAASGLTVKAGYTFSFGPTGEECGPAAPNEVLLGLAYATPLGRRVKAEFGTIAGTVTDIKTGKPLAARVSFPENPTLKSLSTNPVTGAFKVGKVSSGAVVVEVSAEGYHGQTTSLNVEAGGVSQYQFRLKPLVTYGVIAGVVTDAATNGPLAATIEFPGKDMASVMSNSGTGAFRVEKVPVGVYTVTASAEGYLKASQTVEVREDDVASATFALQSLKEGAVITIPGIIYFDVDEAIVKPESRPALEEAAKILKENPGIKVEIQGHTDSDGSDSYNLQLSQRRAQAVVSYLVEEFGIAEGRLTARGYGESKPVATNSTDEGKALNRRVEFVIKSGK